MMNEETKLELERGPRPLPWVIAIFSLALTAWFLRSLLVAGLAGLALGYYEGFYFGSLRVLRSWRRDLELERREIESELTPCKD